MLQTLHNNEFSPAMDLFKEIDDLSDLFFLEKNDKLDSTREGFEDLQSKYSSLHETYSKEIENSKKVEKCLIKCLKFYSKLCKKYEVQQKIIRDLEESIKEKVSKLEEAQKNEEKMKGLIEVYRTERALYAGQTNMQLRKEKEILLDICCKLMDESVRNSSISSLSSLLLRKFKKDLNEEKITVLKEKSVKLKDELEFTGINDFKPDFRTLKEEMVFKFEEKYSSELTKAEMKYHEDVEKNMLDLNMPCELTIEETSSLSSENSARGGSKTPPPGIVRDESEVVSSLPALDVPPTEFSLRAESEPQGQDDAAIHNESKGGFPEKRRTEPNPELKTKSSNSLNTLIENVDEFLVSEKIEEPALENHSHAPSQRFQTRVALTSIFDISDVCPAENINREKVPEESESFPCVSFDCEKRVEEVHLASNTKRVELDLINSDEEAVFPYERELFKIFREMTSVRVLSPIRERNNESIINKKNNEKMNSGPRLKRNSSTDEICCKYKKLKSEEEQSKSCLLDSIMSAMSIQNEEFKSKRFEKTALEESDGMTEGSSCEFGSPETGRATAKRQKTESCKSDENSTVIGNPDNRRSKNTHKTMEKLVTEEIRNFVSSPIPCKEEADKNVKRCISVLQNKPEDVIARCIVATVLENVDEAVEVFERPAPPLTKTQHRLIVLLSVFRTLDWNSERISCRILSLISEKLFPDNFFWPDDSVEAASRFYAALCRARNDLKTLWRFCLESMTEMKQRCPLLVFTILKTWPDVLHNASTLKNNMLAVTMMNIFLNMPKTEGLRNLNQRRKLLALKHLLINFYQFKVEDTMESFTKKVLNAVLREESGSEKSVVLLVKCRDPNWTIKNVMPILKSTLVEWFEGNVKDSIANTILSVIKQICPILQQEESIREKVKDFALCISEILTSGKKNHESEVNLIEVLLLLKQYPEVRKVIREWIPKNPINDSLRNDIINASAENILRELKLNRRKDPKKVSVKKKQWKKSKGKKKKGAKGKRTSRCRE